MSASGASRSAVTPSCSCQFSMRIEDVSRWSKPVCCDLAPMCSLIRASKLRLSRLTTCPLAASFAFVHGGSKHGGAAIRPLSLVRSHGLLSYTLLNEVGNDRF